MSTNFAGTEAPRLVAEALGPNEFFGLAVPWNVPADCGDRYAPGTIKCNGPVICLWEHHCPVGIARLIETEIGIFARGRLSNNTATSQLVLGLLHAGLKFGLCLSVSGEGNPRELTVCLRGGFPGTEITKLGCLDLRPSPWDWAFYPAGLPHLLKAAAESTCLQGLIKAQHYQQHIATNPTNGSLETWLAEMEF